MSEKVGFLQRVKEFWFPWRRCNRVGHDDIQIEVRGFAWPAAKSFRHVADEVTIHIHECRRCGRRNRQSDDFIERQGLDSLSMPTEHWEQLREDGFFPR